MNESVGINLQKMRERKETVAFELSRITINFFEKYMENIAESPTLREARALENFYKNVAVDINIDEIIVGRLKYREPVMFYSNAATIINEEYVKQWLAQESLDNESATNFIEKIAKVEKIRYIQRNPDIYTAAENASIDSSAATSTFYAGHLVMDYEKVLSKGLDNIHQEIVNNRQNASAVEEGFYEAMDTVLKGIKSVIQHHADKAEEIAEKHIGEERVRFKALAEDLSLIVHSKPETFRQAIQLVWFIYLLSEPDSLGRFDWYLYPFYERDIGKGILDNNKALELIEGFWIRIEEAEAIQNMTIGGLDSNGLPFYNDLTRLCLLATRDMGFKGPNLCLRINKDMPKDYWDEVTTSLGTGQGLPAIYNDQVIINYLLNMNISVEDARNYALGGCSQVNIPGASLFVNDIGMMNIAKCLELTYYNGYDPFTKKQVGLQTGEVEDFKSFEAFVNAFKKQLEYFFKLEADINNKDLLYKRDREGFAVRSLFTSDCLKNGRGILFGGARYNNVQLECIGISNTADILIAIKKAVYDEKKVGFRELLNILGENFKGHEELRSYLINKVPKFGNDIMEVDEIRKEITEFIYKGLRIQEGAFGGNYIPGEVIFTAHEWTGMLIGATPDGRLSGEVLADSAGACQGRDKNGPTSLINSVLRIPNNIPVTCIVLNMKFMKKLWNDKSVQKKIINMFKSFFNRGGMQLQVNVCDAEMLKDAVKNPDKYSSLVVRVGGFSAYFTTLSTELQQDIISRTEY